jgi:hypothetical protein
LHLRTSPLQLAKKLPKFGGLQVVIFDERQVFRFPLDFHRVAGCI